MRIHLQHNDISEEKESYRSRKPDLGLIPRCALRCNHYDIAVYCLLFVYIYDNCVHFLAFAAGLAGSTQQITKIITVHSTSGVPLS